MRKLDNKATSPACPICATSALAARLNAKKVGEDALTLASSAYQGLTPAQIDQSAAVSLKAAAVTALRADKATVFQYGADAYVVIDANGSDAFDNGDGLIKLVGVNADALVNSATSLVLTA
jgi:hypothetical protein